MRQPLASRECFTGTIVAAALAAVAFTSAFSMTAVADSPRADHLRCYRVSDAPRDPAREMEMRSRLGIDSECAVKGVVREVCAPAYDEAGAAAALQAPADAQRPATQAHERFCYEVRCPERALADIAVADRVGARVVSVGAPNSFCSVLEWRVAASRGRHIEATTSC